MGAHVYLNGRMKKKKRKFQTLDRDGGFDARACQMQPHLGFSGQPLAGALSTPLPNADQPLPAWDPSVFFKWCALKQQPIGCNLEEAFHDEAYHLPCAS